MSDTQSSYEAHRARWNYDFQTLNRTWAYCPKGDHFYNPWNSPAPVYKQAFVAGETRQLVFRDENAYHERILNGGAMR